MTWRLGQAFYTARVELIPFLGGTMSVADINGRLEQLNGEFQEMFAASRGGDEYMEVC